MPQGLPANLAKSRSGSPTTSRQCSESCISLLPEDPTTLNDDSRFGFNRDNDFANSSSSTPNSFPPYPPEYRKTAIALGVFVLSTTFNGIIAAFLNDVVPRTPLPDVMFKLFDEQKWAWQVSDTVLMLVTWTHIVFGLLHKHRWVITRRFCFISSQLYFLRGICVAFTWVAVPGAYHASRCVPIATPDEYWRAVMVRILSFMTSFGLSAEPEGKHHLCGDFVYSGHTLILVLSWYSADIHLPLKRCRIVRHLLGVGAVIGMVTLILCRMHYTVDVVVAFAVTTLYFVLYHVIIYSGHVDRQWRPYVCTAFWFYPLMEYLERNVPKAKLPRVLEWPFQRPVFIRQFVKSLNDEH